MKVRSEKEEAPKNEDGLKKEDDPKNEDDPENEESPKVKTYLDSRSICNFSL